MQLTQVELGQIRPDADNIRDNADDADITSLAADIAKHGLLQPIVVYVDDTAVSLGEPGYVISAGHRRFHAIAALGWTHADVNVITAPASDVDRLDLMAAENLQRRQLNPIEEARYYQRCIDAGRTQTQIAETVDRPQGHVSRMLSLLDFSADIQARISSGEISVNAALKLMKRARAASGTARADMGATHHQGYVVPWFTSSHPLRPQAASHCSYNGHDPLLRIGGACGQCWERSIRLTAGAEPTSAGPAGVPRQRRHFTDPRDILRSLTCTRCDLPAIDREQRRCSVVRDDKRIPFEHHDFVMEVVADV